LNFAGPIDTKALNDSPVALDGERFSFGAKPGFVHHHASDAHVVVPDAHLLFSGHYVRIGSDLIISNGDQKFVVGNYFKGESRPMLTSNDGATLSGHVVDALTGHVHYAQAAAPAATAPVIGHVLKMSGSATAVRNGVSVELHTGDAVQKGDVVQTGSDSSIGLTFVDGSAFGMTSNARMVLNEMIYDPNGSSNSSLISLVQGTITFVAGQTAKNGNMRVETPVATMGIRGTAVLVEIAANDGPTKFSVLVEPDGHTGSFNLYDKTNGQLIGTVSQAGQVTLVSSMGIGQPPNAVEQLKTLADQEASKALIQDVFRLYFPNYNPDNSNPKTQKFGSSSVNNLADLFFGAMKFGQLAPPPSAPPPVLTYVDPHTGVTYNGRIFFNTKALFSAVPVFSDQAFSPITETFKFADVVRIDDPDIGNAPFYDIGVPFVAGSAIIKSAVSTIDNVDEAFLKTLIHINQTTGQVTFDRQQFNFLDDGQTVTFKIQVTATSGPDTGQILVPVTITGANDAPTIVVGAVTIIDGAVKEDTAVTSGHIDASGTITFQDVDLTDAHTAGVALTSTASSLPGFIAGTEIGHFSIGSVSENATDADNHGSVGWHFTLDDNDPTLQSLAKDQTITQVYTITITDDNGVPVTQQVTITITGTNDTPVLSADASVHQAVEVPNTTGAPDTTVDVATGTLVFTDVDLSDTHLASATLHPGTASVHWSGGDYLDIPLATRNALTTAMTAVVSEDNTDTGNQGSVGWEFKLPDHLFDFLADGETLTLIYDVTVTDNNGLSSTKQVTVQIGAANDQPVISVIDNSAAVTEDISPVAGILKDSGSVTFTDTDLTDTHTAHVVYNDDAVASGSAAVSPALADALATALTVPVSALAAGDHDFDWNFALDNSLAQYLADGETVTATYTITVADSSGEINATSPTKTVTVTITGTNDTPVITAVDVDGAVKEDASVVPVNLLHDTGSVTFADVDATDHETASVAFVGDITSSAASIPNDLHSALQSALTLQASSFSSNSGTVNWDFDLDNSLVQYLAEGETVTVTYTIAVKDDSGVGASDTSALQTVTVVITGTNDTPVIAVTSPAAVTEGNTGTPDVAVVTVADHVSITDVDTTDAHVRYVTDTLTFDATHSSGPAPAIGVLADLFTLNGTDGTISYDRAAFDYLAAGEHVTATFTFDTSSGPDTVQKSITVTIDGANDAPSIAVTSPAHDIEGNTGIPEVAVVTVADHVSITDVDTTDAHVKYVTDTLTFDATHSSGPAPSGGVLADLFTLNETDGTISYDKAAFDYLAGGEHVTATFTFDSSSGPDTLPQSITITIDGENDAPAIFVTNPVADAEGNTGTPDVAVVTVADHVSITGVDASEVHVPYVADTLAFDAGSSGGPAPVAGVLADLFTLNETDGTISYDRAAFDYLAAGEHVTATFTFDASSGPDTLQRSITVTIDGVNDAPTIGTTGFQIAQSGGTTTISNLSVLDPDTSDTFTLAVTADHGTAAVSPTSGNLTDINDALTTGITYTPTGTPATDKIAFTVTDAAGAHDTVNFIFNVAGTGPVTLQGTSEKDVFFATGYQDTFVFGPGSNQDIVTGGFQSGTDKIDLQALPGMTASALTDLLATGTEHVGIGGSDMLLHLNGTTDTLLLKGVATLNSSDFILHA
jgi:VCBS repeat-containing protein